MLGAYGPVVETQRHPTEKLVSTYGLSLAARVTITKEQIEAAKRANISSLTLIQFEPYRYWPDDEFPTDRPLTSDEIGARVVRQPHETPEEYK
jgi:hypothetical protein